jgi:hypothetical protein
MPTFCFYLKQRLTETVADEAYPGSDGKRSFVRTNPGRITPERNIVSEAFCPNLKHKSFCPNL